MNQKSSRRDFLYGSAACLAASAAQPVSAQMQPHASFALKQAAQHSGKILGMFTVAQEVLSNPAASAMIADTFSLIADGNDLKFTGRLRPTPTTYDFSTADAVVGWAQQHNLLFRGHCLVWWNALPSWFNGYVNGSNAQHVMTDHIDTVLKRYAGKVYSWDVVNEPIYHDNRPDGLRKKPWLDFMGPQYIDTAFRTAHAADPKAKLVLNECYIEHDTPGEQGRRASLLALVTRLKKGGVPITTVGVQSHLRGATPLDKPGMVTFFKQVQDLGLDVMVTELDVDDVDVPGPMIDQTVAAKYNEYLELVTPYVKVITFEQLTNDPSLPKRPDGLPHRPNLWDAQFKPTPAYSATVTALHKKARG